MLLIVDCVSCKTAHTIEMTLKQLMRYQTGEGLVQEIFPDMDRAIREMLISGMCPECWSRMILGADNVKESK